MLGANGLHPDSDPSPGVPRLMAGERHTYLADDASPLRQAGYGGVGRGLRIDGRRSGLPAALRRGRRRLGFDAVALFDFEVGQAFGVRAGAVGDALQRGGEGWLLLGAEDLLGDLVADLLELRGGRALGHGLDLPVVELAQFGVSRSGDPLV